MPAPSLILETSPEYTLKPSSITITEFLSYFKIEGKAHFAAWDKKDFRNNRRRVLNLDKKGRDELIKWSKKGTVSLGFLPNNADSDKEVVVCHSLFVEFDDYSSLEAQIDKIRAVSLPEPTFIVSTGNKSHHFYWCLDTGISPDDFTFYQKHLSAQLGSDPAIHNPARTMRLPHSIHPATGIRGTVVHFSGKTYPVSAVCNKAPNEKQPLPLVPRAEVDHHDNAPILKYIDKLEDVKYSYKGNSLTSRCPNHTGKSTTVFWVNLSTGKFCCHAGCNSSEVLRTLYKAQ